MEVALRGKWKRIKRFGKMIKRFRRGLRVKEKELRYLEED